MEREMSDHVHQNSTVDDMSSDEYHQLSNIGKSGLDLVDRNPADYIWRKNAPVDKEKLKTLDYGTNFHAFVLEPDLFREQYKVLPAFNRRKPAEKQAELDLIAEWSASGIIAVTDEDYKKLNLMRDSVYAHPTAKEWLESEGKAEQSVFWKDSETEVWCKCRPDFLSTSPGLLAVDLKTAGDLSTIQKSIANFRYHVQDAFYSSGLEEVFNEHVDFVFIFVSTSINCGRYPVRTIRLDECAKFEGKQIYKQNLRTFEEAQRKKEWALVEDIDLPKWAYLEADII